MCTAKVVLLICSPIHVPVQPQVAGRYSKNVPGMFARIFAECLDFVCLKYSLNVCWMFPGYWNRIFLLVRQIFGSSIRGIFSEHAGNISNGRTPNTQRIFAQTFPEHSLNIFLLPGRKGRKCLFWLLMQAWYRPNPCNEMKHNLILPYLNQLNLTDPYVL